MLFERFAYRIAARILPAVAILFGLTAVARADEPALPAAAQQTIDFAHDVQPILASACYSCHGPDDQTSDYRLDVRESALHGGDIGGSIIPGNSAESPLIRYVAGLDEDMLMPADGEALTAEQVGILRAWIDQGAIWPDELSGEAVDKADHWAFKPMSPHTPPAVQQADWPRQPLDHFILARLEAEGLAPSPEADKRTLLRRVYFDLIGLPPTPEEVDAFLADASPDAYERVVDRLLASPRYGERWARHWMDVVHFAETHGHDQDRPRPNSWPYRDYLIGALNDDMPYAQFVQQQIAGDVLFPNDPQGIVATGFIAAGPWDESSLMSIVDETSDKKIAQYLDRDDMVTTTMSTFASATVHCARCHNHKFDPFSQEDYYALQAVFAGVDRANRVYDPAPQVHQTRQALLVRKKELAAPRETQVGKLLEPTVQQQVAAWEASLPRESGWTVLTPESVLSSSGSQYAIEADGSVLFSGARPEKDTYTLTAALTETGITAIRLEVMADERLPMQGPGRQDNGNLHLSEVRVLLKQPGQADTQLAIARATADFDQDGWAIGAALDGNPATAWGIYPEVGKTHTATLQLASPLAVPEGGRLVVVLDQLHGGGHLIGRPRISATTSAAPELIQPRPLTIDAILQTPAEQRTEAQRLELAHFVLSQQIEQEMSALPAPEMVYVGTQEFAPDGNHRPAKGCRPVHLLRRGDVLQPASEAVPGALTCLTALPARFELPEGHTEGQRRAALARWLTDPENVLAWRSIVNRVWHYHFGRGIVETPNDLGRMGAAPTHPELLDYLALDFRDHGGSLKRLHRQLVTSAAYRQSSQHREDAARLDANNALLWRMNRVRLDAESIRDAVLQMSGKLDLTMGGPSVKQFIESPGIHVTPNVDYLSFDVDSPASYRRSVYRFLFRTLPDPFMDSMDCADASQLTPTRNTSVTALQALSMLNNRFLVRQCEHLAARVATISPDVPGQIEAAYRLTLGRSPTADESAALAAYAAKHGMANVCRVLINSNEFMFVN